MTRILQVPSGLYIAGAQKIARDIGLQRDKTKFDVQYVVFDDVVDQYEKELVKDGCMVHHLPLPSKIWKRLPAMYSQLKRLMLAEHYDIVHAHCMFQSGIAILAAKRVGIPVRITHSHNSGQNRKRFQLFYDFVMRKLISSCSTQLVACGDSAGEFLFGNRTYHRRGKLILNGVDTDMFRFSAARRKEARMELDLEQRFVIGIVARLEPSKNHSFLLQLMPEIVKKKPETILLIVGDGHEREKLETQARKTELTDYVRFLGSVENVDYYMNAMDVFALPSLFEGMPLTLMEAQSNGLPCVLSENVPTDAIQTNLARVVPLSDKAAWVKMLCETKRISSEKYADDIHARGLDYSQMLSEIYSLYDI